MSALADACNNGYPPDPVGCVTTPPIEPPPVLPPIAETGFEQQMLEFLGGVAGYGTIAIIVGVLGIMLVKHFTPIPPDPAA